MTTIVLIRHGQTEWNRVERFRGRADVPLDETGRAQAGATARRIASEWQPVAVYSSPLSRAVQTAEVNAWYHTPHAASIPDGETLDRVRARAMETVTGLAAHHSGDTIVLVGHTVVNRAILLGVLGLRSNRFWYLRQDTCALNVFETEGDDLTLVTMNDTCRLRLPAQ